MKCSLRERATEAEAGKRDREILYKRTKNVTSRRDHGRLIVDSKGGFDIIQSGWEYLSVC